jgi:hypothetical protein
MPEPDELPSEARSALQCLLTVEEVAPKWRSRTRQKSSPERRSRSPRVEHRSSRRIAADNGRKSSTISGTRYAETGRVGL